MRILKTFLFILFTICAVKNANSQITCPDQVTICNGYFVIEGEFEEISLGYFINVSNLPDYSWSYHEIFPIDGNLTFQLEGDYPDSGTFEVWSWEDNNSCWGSFVNTICTDYLLPETIDCEIEGGLGSGITESTPCDSLGQNVVSYNFKGFCLGDTSRINITPEQLNLVPNPLYPFSLERLQLNNGYVIAYDELGFDVVWDLLGTECIQLYTEIENGGRVTTAISVRVDERVNLDILANGSSTESIEVCMGETVELSTTIYENFNTIWKVNNGNEYYSTNYNVTYETPGEYEIILSPALACNCALADTITITVLPGEVPGIDCTSTVCVGSEVIYYSEMECDTYLWSISSEGVIIDGGGPLDYFITVQWLSGDSGEITLNTPGCLAMPCRESVTEVIPIIDGDATIFGEDEVCYGELQAYTLLNYTGTDIEWSLDGPGIISGSRFRNTLLVQWLESAPENTAIISVTFENCNLGCAGYGSLEVDLLEDINIELGDRKYCDFADLSVTNNIGYNVDWTLIHPDGTEGSYANMSMLNVTVSDVGKHTIRLSNPSSPTCNILDEITFQIFENPNIPLAIDGPEIICKENFVQYTIPNLGPYDIVHWQVFDGSTTVLSNSFTGRNLNIAWQSDGPYMLSASIENSITRCVGEATIEVYDSEFTMMGPGTICLATENFYTISPYYGGEIEWSISPVTAAEVIYTQGDLASIVPLDQTSFTVSALYCAHNSSVSVDVPLYEVNIVHDEIICPDDLGSIEITAPIGSTAIVKTFPGNNTINNSLSSNVAAGGYLVEVVSPYGCLYTEEITIEKYDTFEVQITSPGPFAFCLPHDPIEIFANNLGTGYTYMWYWNNTLLSETSTTLSATDFGIYYVIATDPNGCTSELSNDITLFEAGGVPGPIVVIDQTDITCQHKSFTVFDPYESTIFNWSFGDGSTATGNNVEHVYTAAGYYIVGVSGNGGCGTFTGTICGEEETSNACEGGLTTVIIPLVADFRYVKACANQPTQFVDLSSILPTVITVNYEWTFFDTVNGTSTSNDKNPTYVFTDAGNYIVRLEIEDPVTSCVSSKELIVEVVDLPGLTFDFEINSCIGYQIEFTASSSDPDLRYLWQFGETINGKESTSREQNTEYTYTTTGNHLVQLTAVNQNGCSRTFSQDIDIATNSLGGQILSDTSYPKCPGDNATLTAPEGATYIWSNNETTRQIDVVIPGTYNVTVTNSDGCEYTPFAHLVSDVNLGNTLITATEYEGNIIGQVTHLDSLTVCKDQPFTLQINLHSNLEYTWTGGASDGKNTSELNYSENFISLSAGNYDYFVNVRDPLSNCEADFGPFHVTIIDLPSSPILEADDNSLCIGDPTTVTITNYDPNMTYSWNNGFTGSTYTGIAENTFFVTATNSNGCQALSNPVAVRNKPSVNAWMSGCMEVCFPRELCLRLTINQTLDYSLIKDGEFYSFINPPISTLEITEPGDYQLQAENIYGCKSISEILSLSASPDDHQLSGIVFIDYNENGTYEITDSLLSGIPVTLYNGNTTVDNIDTDIDGFYLFDPIFYTNLTAEIDISNVNLLLSGDLDSILIYTECVEDKIINFPLISTCPKIETDTLYHVCFGESVIVDGNEFFANEMDTLRYTFPNGCDSLYIVNVIEFEEPEIFTTVDGTCEDTDSGSLYINILNGSDLSFSVDSDPNTFIDTFIHDLSSGTHILYIHDNSQCEYLLPFNIPIIDSPLLEITPTFTCEGENDGYIEIGIITGVGLTFSLDANGVFNDGLLLENIEAGNHILYIRDENNCDFNQPFAIEELPEPEIMIEPSGTCINQDRGDILINIISGNNFLFSLNNSENFMSIVEFEDLPDGEHTLYILDGNGCEYTSTFTIPLFPEAIFNLDVNNACGNSELGNLSITPISEGMQFSLDTDDDFSTTIQYTDLVQGEHMIYAMSAEGCIDSLNFIIENITTAQIDFEIISSCENIGLGTIQIDSIHMGESFAIDGADFSANLLFEGLSVGQHILQYQYDEGCIFDFPFEILLISEPLIELEPTSTCQDNNDGILTISTSDSDLLYSINNIDYVEDNIFTQLSEGPYILYVQNTEDCTYEYQFDIIEIDIPSINVQSENSCVGDATGTITIDSLQEENLISINDGAYTSDLLFENLPAGMYTIEVIDPFGCSNATEIEITENPELIVNVSVQDNDCYPEAFFIDPEISSSFGTLQYQWNDGSTEEKYLANTTEEVTLIISDDCQSLSYSWDLIFSPAADNNHFYVPNIFSPNNDGINDCFVSTFSPEIELISYHQMIFDRWGNRMFQTENENDCWDGIFQGEPMVTGVYVYVTTIEVRDCSGDRSIKKIGDVTIIR